MASILSYIAKLVYSILSLWAFLIFEVLGFFLGATTSLTAYIFFLAVLLPSYGVMHMYKIAHTE
jgi:hypothetical protein